MIPRSPVLLAGMAVAPLLALGGALLTQHVGGMMPCAWCVMQRLIFVAIAASSLLALLLGSMHARSAGAGQRVGAALAGLLAGCGMATALWQHFVASASTSCNMSFADRLMGFTGLDSRWPEVFAAYASCADAKASLVGVPYEFWSLTLFALLALAALRVTLQPR